MVTTKALTRVAALAAALLVNTAIFLAAGRSIQSAGQVLGEDDAHVVQLDRVVVSGQRPTRTASLAELSNGTSF
jgi:hypothetical protein